MRWRVLIVVLVLVGPVMGAAGCDGGGGQPTGNPSSLSSPGSAAGDSVPEDVQTDVEQQEAVENGSETALDVPSEDAARSGLENQVSTDSQGFMRLVSCTKTDGLAYENAGIQGYDMMLDVEVEVVEDCSEEAGFSPFAARPVPTGYSPDFVAGERLTFKGDVVFMLTENGWQYSDFRESK